MEGYAVHGSMEACTAYTLPCTVAIIQKANAISSVRGLVFDKTVLYFLAATPSPVLTSICNASNKKALVIIYEWVKDKF